MKKGSLAKPVIILSISVFPTLVALSIWNKGIVVDVLPKWLTAIGTVGAVIVAQWQTKKANDARYIEKREQEIAEQERNSKTLQLIDSLTSYERRRLSEARIKILTYIHGKRELPNQNIENWDSITKAYYNAYFGTIPFHKAHGFSRAFGRPVTTSDESLNNVKNVFKKINNQSGIYNVLISYREVLSNNLSSYHTLLDETSIDKISTRLLSLNICLDKIKEYEDYVSQSIELRSIAESVLKYTEDLDEPLYKKN